MSIFTDEFFHPLVLVRHVFRDVGVLQVSQASPGSFNLFPWTGEGHLLSRHGVLTTVTRNVQSSEH